MMQEQKIHRQVVLDTETTRMNIIGAPHIGHNIIEIGAVEVINRRLHQAPTRSGRRGN